MRILKFAVVFGILTATASTKAAEDRHNVDTRPGASLPAKAMQTIGPSSAFDVPPKFISGDAPIYPITRLRLGEPGFAMVSFVVDEAGRTRDIRVEKTNYSFFGSHAVAAVQKWRFQPATKRGRPVSCRVQIPFKYRVGR